LTDTTVHVSAVAVAMFTVLAVFFENLWSVYCLYVIDAYQQLVHWPVLLSTSLFTVWLKSQGVAKADGSPVMDHCW